MHAAVFVPGIMATRLSLPNTAGGAAEEVWPPSPIETKTRYKRIDKLRDPNVVHGDIIRRVLCYDFYNTLRYFDRPTWAGRSTLTI